MILQASNLIYVDQPIGTGFSYVTDRRDIRHTEDGVSNDIYDFLQVIVFATRITYKSRLLSFRKNLHFRVRKFYETLV